jgi:hypothetical protein
MVGGRLGWKALIAALGVLLAVVFDLAISADRETSTASAVAPALSADKFMVVDCLLPGQIRRLGTKVTYLTPRRPAKIAAGDCELRGGEYVAYDRADLSIALAAWLPGASEGDKQAQTYVGEIYEKGLRGGAPDYAQAAGWYQKAAAQGHPRAMMNLGFLYEQGRGVKQDMAAALALYRKAAGLGDLIMLDELAQSDRAKREAETQSLRQELESARKQLEQAREALERQKRDTESALEHIERERTAAAANAQARTDQVEAQAAQQRQQALEKQRQEVARLEKTVEAYRDQLKRAETESSTLRKELGDVQVRLAETNKELDARKAKASEDQKALDSLKSELEEAKRRSRTAGETKDQVKELESQLKQSQADLTRQREEIAKLEKDSLQYKQKIAELEKTETPAPAPSKDGLVAIAPPSIQLIDPPLLVMRNAAAIRVRGVLLAREIVGRVTAPAGLLSFAINDRPQPVDGGGMFKAEIALQKTSTPVSLVAVDMRGRRAALDFSLVPEELAEAHAKPPGTPLDSKDFGTYHALVIGNSKYHHLPSLDTAAEDAEAISELLSKKYSFKVTKLIDANRYQILSELNRLRGQLTEKDNLLLYYAGHGELDRANLRGHWLPVDAEPNNDANWISSVAITDILNAMSVKHVLIVADSCYAGAMTRNSIGQLDPGMSDEARVKWLRALAKARCRTVLTSGGVQPVVDGGGGKHSLFAKSLIEVLQENAEPLEAQRLYREVAARVLNLAQKLDVEQKPEYAPLKFAGHESGDFIFIPVN